MSRSRFLSSMVSRIGLLAVLAVAAFAGASALPAGGAVGAPPTASARVSPLPGAWAGWLMCHGPLKYSWACGYHGGPHA